MAGSWLAASHSLQGQTKDFMKEDSSEKGSTAPSRALSGGRSSAAPTAAVGSPAESWLRMPRCPAGKRCGSAAASVRICRSASAAFGIGLRGSQRV
eukprot:363600-Chlamydomonas_euryale.AAC.2